MPESMIKADIFRFDPSRDASPRYEHYEVPRKEEGMLVGDVLTHIYENIDPSLAFRWECRARQCGACGVMINGKAGLICKEPASDAMCLEPLHGRRVIRDLVVDLGDVTERLNSWFELEEPRRPEQPPLTRPSRDRFRQAEACVECYLCEAMCAVKSTRPNGVREFAGPRRFARLSRNVCYPPDRVDWLKVGAEHGLFNCVVCQNCNEVCPKEVNPADIIVDLQHRVIGTDISTRGVRKVKAWTDSVRKTGKAEGVGIRFKTKGLSILVDVRQAIRLAMKGKLPWPFLKPVREIDAIREIFRQCKDRSP